MYIVGIQAAKWVHNHTDAAVDDKDGLMASCRRTRCSHNCYDERHVRDKCMVLYHMIALSS